MKTWDEILAAARDAGFLRFNVEGIAILERPKQTASGELAPGRRAELALSGLTGDLTSGNLAQGVASFADSGAIERQGLCPR